MLNQISNFDRFAAAHPDAAAWILEARDNFDFAASLHTYAAKHGALTVGQLGAVYRCIEKRKAAQERAATAQAVDVSKMEAAFASAKSKGAKRPKMRAGALVFSLAPVNGRNAGAIYVKDRASDDYLGKIQAGRFVCSATCGAREADVLVAAADPQAAAILHGKQFGECAICGLELTDPESIARGIGPICASKFGWGGPVIEGTLTAGQKAAATRAARRSAPAPVVDLVDDQAPRPLSYLAQLASGAREFGK